MEDAWKEWSAELSKLTNYSALAFIAHAAFSANLSPMHTSSLISNYIEELIKLEEGKILSYEEEEVIISELYHKIYNDIDEMDSLLHWFKECRYNIKKSLDDAPHP